MNSLKYELRLRTTWLLLATNIGNVDTTVTAFERFLKLAFISSKVT